MKTDKMLWLVYQNCNMQWIPHKEIISVTLEYYWSINTIFWCRKSQICEGVGAFMLVKKHLLLGCLTVVYRIDAEFPFLWYEINTCTSLYVWMLLRMKVYSFCFWLLNYILCTKNTYFYNWMCFKTIFS